jgi:nitrite reductase/ring-hydroxylating ferredoxin subunit/uncharacterized membrane protein
MARFRRSRADAAIGRLEAARSLDLPGELLGRAMGRTAQLTGRPSHQLGNALHGRWWGHPLHPALVTIPIGTWTLAFGLDLLALLGRVRSRRAEETAETALAAGAVGAALATAAGLADWQHLNGRDQRVGLVHGVVNSTALGLNLASLQLLRRGRRGEGRIASAAAWACMVLGGYLGGHLVYRRRAGVDHADRSPEPREFTPVLPLAELRENSPRLVQVRDPVAGQDVGVVLVRRDGRVHAMGARCSHAGGPLDQGWVLEGALVCPWHGSRYCLETAQPIRGPSTVPQPRSHVRLRDGMVDIRREQEPGDEVVTSDRLAHLADRIDLPAALPPGTRRADEVLVEHHMLLRSLFRRIEAMPREDPERRDLLRVLASELEIHEYVEDSLFYPAVRPVSEDVSIAHSEHRQLADLLAETLKLNTASPAFEEHLKALHAAVEHHAGSEERSMFVHAQRLGQARLREIGADLTRLLEEERQSRARSAFRALKIRLLEGV